MNPVRPLPPHFPQIKSNILPSTPSSSRWSLLFRFSNQNIVCISHVSHACFMLRPYHPPWLDNFNDNWWSVKVMKLLIMQSSPDSRHFPLRSKHFSWAPCSQTPSIYVLPLVRRDWKTFKIVTRLLPVLNPNIKNDAISVFLYVNLPVVTNLIFVGPKMHKCEHLVTKGDWYSLHFNISISFNGNSECNLAENPVRHLMHTSPLDMRTLSTLVI
jgi:hypothetical protein